MKLPRELVLLLLVVAWGSSRDPFPGEPVDGLELRASVSKTVFNDAEPIIVSPSFSNPSSATIVFWDSGFWPNTKVELLDSNRHPIAMTQEGLAKRRAFAPGGSRDKNVPVHLPPLGVYRAEPFDLRPLFTIQTNTTCFVELTYEERQPEHWRGKVISNPVRINTK